MNWIRFFFSLLVHTHYLQFIVINVIKPFHHGTYHIFGLLTCILRILYPSPEINGYFPSQVNFDILRFSIFRFSDFRFPDFLIFRFLILLYGRIFCFLEQCCKYRLRNPQTKQNPHNKCFLILFKMTFPNFLEKNVGVVMGDFIYFFFGGKFFIFRFSIFRYSDFRDF